MTTTAGDAIWFDNMLMEVLLPAAATGGTISILEQTHFRGYATPVHRHGREDQTVYVLTGGITAWLDGEERSVKAGELVHLPRGRSHAFRVDEDGTRLLEINTPGGFEEFHAEVGQPAAERGLPERRPLDIAKMVAVASAYDCEILGPPRT
jgi:mannose-6-phosphate isomerase-like protein (cupin superfamily)